MVEAFQFTLSGVSFGMIYAGRGAVPRAEVARYPAAEHAQGGVAMLTTYVAIEVIYHTGSYSTGFVAALAAGIVPAWSARSPLIRPTLTQAAAHRDDRDHRALILLEGLAGHLLRRPGPAFPTAFSQTGLKTNGTPLGVSLYDVFVAAAVLVTTLALAAAFRYSSAGLRMRGRRSTPPSRGRRASGWRGCSPSRWALAGLLGALASFLNAQKVPDVFVASGCECWNDPSKYPEYVRLAARLRSGRERYSGST